MKIIISTIIFAVLGFALGMADVSPKNWQFWVVMICAALLKLLEAIPWKEL